MPQTIKIFSENDIFQNLETLGRKREKRNKMKQFIFEGVRNINNALKYGWNIDSFIYSPEKKLSDWALENLKKSNAKHHYEMPIHLLKKLSAKEETSELIATAEIPSDDFQKIPLKDNFLVVVFDRPSSPGNLGTLIRSCDALGVHGLIVTGHAVDLYDPEVIRASTGSFFALPMVRKPSHKELLSWFEKVKEQLGNLQIVGTDEKSHVSLDEYDFTKPTILLVGNETLGLSEAYKQLSDQIVKIPIKGSASSLNVACASSIVLYEVMRQRGIH